MVYDRFGVRFMSDVDIDEGEADAYIERAIRIYGGQIEAIEARVDDDMVELKYIFRPVGFERVRRITGYLVGTLDRWNDAKRAEEHDRVKHGVGGSR